MAGQRADVDYLPAALNNHMFGGRLARKVDTFQVGIHDRVIIRFGNILEHLGDFCSRAVDEYINSSVPGGNTVDYSLDLTGFGKISG